MIIKRKLTEEERNYLMEACRKDMGRKLVRGIIRNRRENPRF